MDVILTLIPDSPLETFRYDLEKDVILTLILDSTLQTVQYDQEMDVILTHIPYSPLDTVQVRCRDGCHPETYSRFSSRNNSGTIQRRMSS